MYDDYGPGGPPRGQKRGGGGRSGPPADYVEVNQRVIEFHEHYPQGVIWTEVFDADYGDGAARVGVKAYAQREPDQKPFTGHSDLKVPGSTPYTNGSELENAETSAVGRALAFMGIGAKRSLASLDEIRAKQSQHETPTKPQGEPEEAKAATEPSADAEGKENPTETLPEQEEKPKPKRKRKPKAKAEPKHDPDLVDPKTGEVIGLTRDEFVEGLKARLIPSAMAASMFAKEYPEIDPKEATPAQRKAVFDALVEDVEAAAAEAKAS